MRSLFQQPGYSDGVISGFIIGMVFAVTVIALGTQIPGRVAPFLSAVSVLIAAVVAYVTATGAERRRRELEMRSVRSALSISLSRICDYCDEALQTLEQNKERFDGYWNLGDMRGAQISLPELPAVVISDLVDAAKLGDAELSKSCAGLLSRAQLTDARIRSLLQPRGRDGDTRSGWHRDADRTAITVATFRMAAETLFGYARFETERIPDKIDQDTFGATVFHLRSEFRSTIENGVARELSRHASITPSLRRTT
ncbi:MAG: hypothetical protein AAFV09_01680 [Pseudomonadota bacterium]